MPKPKDKISVGLTMGDPSGIGPEIIAKALSRVRGWAEFTIIGDRRIFEKRHKEQGTRHKFVDLANVKGKGFCFGEVRAEYGRASIEYLDKALDLIEQGEIDCLVTCPISKEAINLAGFKFSGHTEYLVKRTGAKDTVMMLLNRSLRISLVTRHIALKDVSRQLNKDKLSTAIILTHCALKKEFRLKNPRMVVCGVNPHASDNGIIGKEENQLIRPLIQSLRKKIKYLNGPLPADIAVAEAAAKKYDAVIAMYHDQALIPLKLYGNQYGVNLTLGLPFIRTSPLHGTAFDIAGLGVADIGSLVEAIRLAIRCTLNRKNA